MNKSHFILHVTASCGRPRRGFALVVTLSLLILLTVIAVSLLSLATVSLRSSSRGLDIAQARANAQIGMMMAIGDLQKYTGPDQRVTASAALAGYSQNSMWTGVWKTITDKQQPMVSGYTNHAYLTDLRNTDSNLMNGKWKESLRLAWLVSGAAIAPDKVSLQGTDSIQLVGNTSLGGNMGSTDPRLVSAWKNLSSYTFAAKLRF